ncbi:hypothetical protein ACEWY4_002095 [Coilia grayii]|uniref:PDZ domain-containing protein n=1 Tax=Coilia grayii TaxID=363190 RepID=A0ABD1KUU7_9TELE
MMTRRPGRSFRQLVKRGTTVRDSLWGKLTSQHRHAGHGYKTPGDDKSNTNKGQDLKAALSEPPLSCLASLRRSLVLEKEDHETFGFEITCNDSSAEDLRVAVSSVEPHSPAGIAGMKPGDVLVSVNDVSVSECPHQQISDTILNSGSIIRLETISAVMAKQVELKRKLWQLQCRLEEKRGELYSLAARERHLTGGKLGKCSLGESTMSLISFPDDNGSSGRGSSGSRLSACGSVSAGSLCSAFEDLSFSPLSIRDSSSSDENRQSFSFSDSAHSSNSNAPSPLGYPLPDEDSSGHSSTPQSLRRRSPKGRSKQNGALNRLTNLFAGSRGSVAEAGIQEDV